MSRGLMMPIFSIIGSKFDHSVNDFSVVKVPFSIIINMYSLNTVWVVYFPAVFPLIVFAFINKSLPESVVSMVIVKKDFLAPSYFHICWLVVFCKKKLLSHFLFLFSKSFRMDSFLFNTLWTPPVIIHFDAQNAPDLASGNPFQLALVSFWPGPISFQALGPKWCYERPLHFSCSIQNQPCLQGANPAGFEAIKLC